MQKKAGQKQEAILISFVKNNQRHDNYIYLHSRMFYVYISLEKWFFFHMTMKLKLAGLCSG